MCICFLKIVYVHIALILNSLNTSVFVCIDCRKPLLVMIYSDIFVNGLHILLFINLKEFNIQILII